MDKEKQGYTIERGYDYKGADLANGHLTNVESAEKCADICGETAGCKSFTYNKNKNSQNYYKHCWLKNKVKHGRRPLDCCDSGLPHQHGYTIERGFKYKGGDLVGGLQKDIESAEKCAEMCGETVGCLSFVYVKKTGTDHKNCVLKEMLKPGREQNDCCDSGLPYTGTNSTGAEIRVHAPGQPPECAAVPLRDLCGPDKHVMY